MQWILIPEVVGLVLFLVLAMFHKSAPVMKNVLLTAAAALLARYLVRRRVGALDSDSEGEHQARRLKEGGVRCLAGVDDANEFRV